MNMTSLYEVEKCNVYITLQSIAVNCPVKIKTASISNSTLSDKLLMLLKFSLIFFEADDKPTFKNKKNFLSKKSQIIVP